MDVCPRPKTVLRGKQFTRLFFYFDIGFSFRCTQQLELIIHKYDQCYPRTKLVLIFQCGAFLTEFCRGITPAEILVVKLDKRQVIGFKISNPVLWADLNDFVFIDAHYITRSFECKVFGYSSILRTAVYRLCLYTDVQAEIAALGRRSPVRQVFSGQIVAQPVAYIG